MCRTSQHESILAFSLPRGAVVALGLLVLLFAFALDAAAQKSKESSATTGPGVVAPVSPPDAPPSFTQYIPAGYSKEGPLRFLSATPEAIKFYTTSEKLVVVLDLKGTNVSVRDINNKVLSFGALKKGTRVYVSRSPDKKIVLIFVVPSTGKETSDAV